MVTTILILIGVYTVYQWYKKVKKKVNKVTKVIPFLSIDAGKVDSTKVVKETSDTQNEVKSRV
jgi:hypothetical protein